MTVWMAQLSSCCAIHFKSTNRHYKRRKRLNSLVINNCLLLFLRHWRNRRLPSGFAVLGVGRKEHAGTQYGCLRSSRSIPATDAAHTRLENRIADLIDLRGHSGEMKFGWFSEGNR